jgi:hypothetical protein
MAMPPWGRSGSASLWKVDIIRSGDKPLKGFLYANYFAKGENQSAHGHLSIIGCLQGRRKSNLAASAERYCVMLLG